MKPEDWVHCGGAYHVTLALFHLGFWKLFRWRDELPRLNVLNRGVVPAMNVMLIYAFVAVAVIEFWLAGPLTSSSSGRVALLAIAGFWLVRMAIQPLFWPRTRLSWLFFAAFALGAILHGAALASALP